ncbi:MAG: methyltransferase domain-containing protein [Verrucomicrobiae bacterium]|nr:methyltransferase domain-containing protein [Verrucomicrobiae bacterium]
MSESYAKQFYDRISHAYDLIADGGERAARERGLTLLDVQEGESVLEIGYGTGHSLTALAKQVGDSGRVTGIDISTGMRDVAEKRLAEAGLSDRVDLLVEEVPPMSCDSDDFDAITMSFTLELFPLETIPSVLKECGRVLRPSGRLGVVSMATVSEDEKESLMERAYVWMHTHFPHIVDCQPIQVEALLEDNGFKCITRERVDLFSMPVAIVVAKKA